MMARLPSNPHFWEMRPVRSPRRWKPRCSAAAWGARRCVGWEGDAALRVPGLERDVIAWPPKMDWSANCRTLSHRAPDTTQLCPGQNWCQISGFLAINCSNTSLYRALRLNDGPCHGPHRTLSSRVSAPSLAPGSGFARYGFSFRSLCFAGAPKLLIRKRAVSHLMKRSTCRFRRAPN